MEEKRWRAGPTRLVKLAVGFVSLFFFHLSLVAEGQRDNRIELAKTTGGSCVSEETSKSHRS